MISNEPMRVLQVIRQMDVGGAETFIMNIYRNIDRKKVQFDFLVTGNGFFDEEIKSLGGHLYYMKYITQIGELNYKKQLISFFKAHPEYRIVHSHIDQVSGIILQAANRAGVPNRIAHSHSTKNTNSVIGKIYKSYLQSKINNNATLLLACGENAAKWLYKKRAKEAILINNGIDIEKYKYSQEKRKKIRDELHISDDTTIMLHVGRLSKEKNQLFLLDIYRNYLDKNLKSLLIMVGDGPLKGEILQKIKKYNLQEKVKLLGIRQDVDALYSAADYVVFPSLYEGISLALIEAQISGLKIFASDSIDKNTDISGNIQWINLKDSPSKWSELILKTDKTRNFSNIKEEKYDIKKVAYKLQNIYLKIGEIK